MLTISHKALSINFSSRSPIPWHHHIFIIYFSSLFAVLMLCTWYLNILFFQRSDKSDSICDSDSFCFPITLCCTESHPNTHTFTQSTHNTQKNCWWIDQKAYKHVHQKEKIVPLNGIRWKKKSFFVRSWNREENGEKNAGLLRYDNRKILSHDIKTSSYSIEKRQTHRNGFTIDPSSFSSAPLSLFRSAKIRWAAQLSSGFSFERNKNDCSLSIFFSLFQCKFRARREYYITAWVDSKSVKCYSLGVIPRFESRLPGIGSGR